VSFSIKSIILLYIRQFSFAFFVSSLKTLYKGAAFFNKYLFAGNTLRFEEDLMHVMIEFGRKIYQERLKEIEENIRQSEFRKKNYKSSSNRSVFPAKRYFSKIFLILVVSFSIKSIILLYIRQFSLSIRNA